MTQEHYNVSSSRAQDQQYHDFVHESGLPRDYFRNQERRGIIPQLSDGWVALIVVLCIVAGILAVGAAK